jgi:hypothetical protein
MVGGVGIAIFFGGEPNNNIFFRRLKPGGIDYKRSAANSSVLDASIR